MMAINRTVANVKQYQNSRTKFCLAILILTGLLILGAEPCSAQMTTPTTFTMRIKQGVSAWVSVPVDSFFKQYTYSSTITAEPQFATFEANGTVTVEVTANYTITSYKLKPLGLNIPVTQSGQKLTFDMNDNIRQLCLELNGDQKKLFLVFKNPVAVNPPTASATGVQYFGPGYQKVGGTGAIVASKTGTTAKPEIIYLDKDAIVEGRIDISNASNIIIKGSGILYNPKVTGSNYTAINVSNSSNIKIQDITCLSRADNWCVRFTGSDHVDLNNVKVINEIRDGIDALNSQSVTVKHSFVMSKDDAFCLKGIAYANTEAVENILLDSSIIANMGGGNAVEIGYESATPYYKNITYSNLDIIYCLSAVGTPNPSWPTGALTIHPTQMTEYNDPRYMVTMPPITDVHYKNIRIESCEDPYIIDIYPNRSSPGFGIKRITFDNIQVVDGPSRPSRIIARDDHPIDSVSFTNLTILGKAINSATDGNFTVTKATHVTFKTLATSIDLTPAQRIRSALSRSVAGKVFDVRGVYIGNYNSDRRLTNGSYTLPTGFFITVPRDGHSGKAGKKAIVDD